MQGTLVALAGAVVFLIAALPVGAPTAQLDAPVDSGDFEALASEADPHGLQQFFDTKGRLVAERGVDPGDSAVSFERHYWFADADSDGNQDQKKSDKSDKGECKGKGNKKCSPPKDPNADVQTDCPSDAYSLAGWHWTAPYSAYTTAFPEAFDAAGATWDAATSSAIFAGVTLGLEGFPGARDDVNQIVFAPMDMGQTVAVTTTWYLTASGEALESDAQYNTAFIWTTDGNPVGMDVQAVATHELGHTLGLEHPAGAGSECLTMFASVTSGDVAMRTLGDGDIIGMRAIYGK